MKHKRIEKLQNILYKKNIDVALLSNILNIQYFSGLTSLTHDEPSAYLLITQNDTILLCSELEESRVKNETGVSPILLSHDINLKKYVSNLSEKNFSLGFDSLSIPFYEYLKNKFKKVIDINPDIYRLRSIKSNEEISLIKTACEITTKTLSKIPDLIKPGMTEKDLAIEIEFCARKLGADESAFSPIVAFGKNSALPHWRPSENVIGKNNILLIDYGARYKGYCADFTRIYSIGKPPEKLVNTWNLVINAFEKSVEKASAGIKTNNVFLEAVNTFKNERLDDFFIHSLGHGVGLAVHESPRISSNEDILKKNMIITIEPGLYFNGIGGIRIENTFKVNDENISSLSNIDYIISL